MQLILPLLTIALVAIGAFCLMIAIDNDRRIRRTKSKGNIDIALHSTKQAVVALASPQLSKK